MGVIHKLKPEVIDFILATKKSEPNLSCRKLSALILDKFKIEISKSSANSIIKQAGLSMPVGRRLKKKRKPQIAVVAKPAEEIKLIEAPPAPLPVPKMPVQKPVEKPLSLEIELPSTGAILLKIADYLLGGSRYFTQAIKSYIRSDERELSVKTEGLIYLSLEDISMIRSLINAELAIDDLISYLVDLKEVRALNTDILRIISTSFPEVRGIEANLSPGGISYRLDGQLYTVWSTPHIPYDFSTTLCNINSYIERHFQKEEPFVLGMAPGYDTPTTEFFDFILSLEGKEKEISQITLYGNKLEKIQVIPIPKKGKRFFIFGLWPWQYVSYRHVKNIGEIRKFYFEPLKTDLYIADTEIEISQPITKQKVTLRGALVKRDPKEKAKVVVLSNFSPEQAKTEDIVNMYLNRWPNLEELFQDFSRKVELFTYTASAQRFFSTENLTLDREASNDIKLLFSHYLKVLDLYVRWHFMPSGYEDKDFPTMNQSFYRLKADARREKECLLITFLPPSGYAHLKDLEYALKRINEKEIIFPRVGRIWLTVSKWKRFQPKGKIILTSLIFNVIFYLSLKELAIN